MKENNGVCSKLQIFQVKAKATFGLDFLLAREKRKSR